MLNGPLSQRLVDGATAERRGEHHNCEVAAMHPGRSGGAPARFLARRHHAPGS